MLFPVNTGSCFLHPTYCSSSHYEEHYVPFRVQIPKTQMFFFSFFLSFCSFFVFEMHVPCGPSYPFGQKGARSSSSRPAVLLLWAGSLCLFCFVGPGVLLHGAPSEACGLGLVVLVEGLATAGGTVSLGWWFWSSSRISRIVSRLDSVCYDQRAGATMRLHTYRTFLYG